MSQVRTLVALVHAPLLGGEVLTGAVVCGLKDPEAWPP